MKKIIQNILRKFGYSIHRIHLSGFTDSSDFKIPSNQNAFWHFESSFNAIEIIQKFTSNSIVPSPNHFTNFLGVKIRPQFFPSLNLPLGMIEPPPLPNSFHADLAEWASCLRAVDLAQEEFIMLELGCGWGCWMNNLGVAAKLRKKKIKVFGVEGDSGHIEFAKQALADNGISKSEYQLIHGIAGKQSGQAFFPKIESGKEWGGEAIFNPSQDDLHMIMASDQYVQVLVVDLSKILEPDQTLDLMHVDIQGAEVDLLSENMEFLDHRVKRIFIGTHSKQIEGKLYELFLSRRNWELEMERPAFHKIIQGKPINVCDGVQLWKNTDL